MNAYRPRSRLAYLLPHGSVTDWALLPGAGRHAAGARVAGLAEREARKALPPGAVAVPVTPRSAASGNAQPVPTKAALRYWLTACSGTRKERPTRIASSSPEWTSR